MLLGAFSSAIFLYGISLIYGVTGTTHYDEIGEVVSRRHRRHPVSRCSSASR